jgi:hypothetical protein
MQGQSQQLFAMELEKAVTRIEEEVAALAALVLPKSAEVQFDEFLDGCRVRRETNGNAGEDGATTKCAVFGFCFARV